ncbi:ParB/RepB/Spo0J family partition protein [Streptomyces olivoreticuli]
MAGRRTSLASLAGQKVDNVPGQSDPLLLTLPLDKLVPTRFNPRRNFGTEDDLKDFGQKLSKRQLQPAVVVSRVAYLKLWPEEAGRVGSASYVIANGERRYRASQAAGRTILRVEHNEDVAKSRADFLDAVLSENNDREDLDPIERALGIETMVKELGGADKVAKHYGKTPGWVSQQRKLLKLTDELQALVSSGGIPVRVARDIAGLPATEQQAAWEAEQQRRVAAQRSPRPKRARKSAELAPSRFTAVNREELASASEQVTPQIPASPTSAGVPSQATAHDAVAERDQRPELATTSETGTEEGDSAPDESAAQPIVIPAGSPADVAEALVAQLSAADLAAVAELLLDRLGGDHSSEEAAAASA